MRGRKGRLAQVCALLGALSVIGLPWLLPYQPALDPAPGVTMNVVTPPLTPVASFVKMAYVFSEDVPCEHELLGWTAENELHYRRQCGAREYIWYVDPDRADEPVAMTLFWSDMRPKASPLRQEEALREQVLEMVRADGYKRHTEQVAHPENGPHPPNPPPPILREGGATSATSCPSASSSPPSLSIGGGGLGGWGQAAVCYFFRVAYKLSDEPSYREIMLREGSLRSPDGQWIAAITQHVYGPQDVVLIKAQ